MKTANKILICKNFQNQGRNKYAELIMIYEGTNKKHGKATLQQRLIEKENSWIEKLETLHLQGMNKKLSR